MAILRGGVKRLQEAFGEVKIVVRADAGFAVGQLYEYCEAERLGYLIGLITNERLLTCTEEVSAAARKQFEQSRSKQRLFAQTWYQAGSWDKSRRVIIKAEHNELGSNRRFVVTNMEGTPQELYDFYALRGDCANRIKELKNDLKADRLSCHRFVANQLRLTLHAAAYVLLTALKRYLKGSVLEKARIATIRCQLIKIGARVVQSCRLIWVHLASGYPLKTFFIHLCHRLAAS
jgi:hypothetical protein